MAGNLRKNNGSNQTHPFLFPKWILLLPLIILAFLSKQRVAFSAPPDISLQWVRHITGQPISSVQYDPSSPNRLPLKIAVRYEGPFCPVSLAIKNIQAGPQVSVSPPIPVPRPDSTGMSYVETFFTIPAGLQFGSHSFEIRIIKGSCPDNNPQNDILTVPIRLVSAARGTESCDYSIESVTFSDGRNLAEGIPYHAAAGTTCSLMVKVKWNKILPAPPDQCINKIQVWSHNRVLLVPPTPTSNFNDEGISENNLLLPLPRGLSPGKNYGIRVELISSGNNCDSAMGNNQKYYFIKLLPPAERDYTDLSVRITKLEKELVYDPLRLGCTFGCWFPRVTFEVFNRGTKALTSIRVDVLYSKGSYRETIYLTQLQPNQRIEKTMTINSFYFLENNTYVRVTVDPNDEISETDEKNNSSTKWYRRI